MAKKRYSPAKLGKSIYVSSFGLTCLMWIGLVKLLKMNWLPKNGAAVMKTIVGDRKFLFRSSPLLLLVLLSGALLTACNRDPEVRKQKYYDSGMKYLEQSKLDEATIQFRNALKIDPEFAEAGTMLGQVHFRRREYREAYQAFQDAVQAQPEYLPARKAIAGLYLTGGKFSEAQQDAEHVLERSPDDPEALLLLANSQAYQENYQEAEATLNRLLEIMPGHTGAPAIEPGSGKHRSSAETAERNEAR